MNLAYHYPIVYWNAACLSVNAAADEDFDNNKSTDYGKIGVAVSKALAEGINISQPLINEAEFEFTPDAKNNRIIYSLKAMNGIGDDASQAIIQNRPYTSLEDFAIKMLDTKIIKPAQMLKLIKGGCFTTLHSENKAETMEWYLKKYCVNLITNLTLSQLGKAIEFDIVPNEVKLAVKINNFKKYVLDDEGLYEKWIDPTKIKIPKRGYHDGRYILDENSQPFFKEHFSEDSIVDVVNGFYVLSEKAFSKECEKLIQPLRDWFGTQEAVDKYNEALFKDVWNEKAGGTEPAWSMEALCYYDKEHELINVPEEKYGIVDFNKLPEEPVPYEFYTRYIDGKPKAIPKYNISRIAGTVLMADNNHHTVAVLTTHGLVNVKFGKGHYAFYNKRISVPNEDGKGKTVLEESWLKRGNKLMISGYRRGDQFIPWIYNDTIYKHRINLIRNVKENGELELQMERVKV